MSKIKTSLISIMTLGVITSASAMGFTSLGYKSISMGGAGVASSSGSVATYNNPALLGKSKYDTEISLGGGIGALDYGAGTSYKNLQDTHFIDTADKAQNDITTLTSADKQNLINGKNVILNMDGKGVQLSPQAYLGAQIKNFGFGVYGNSDIMVNANVSQTHNRLIFSDGSGNYTELLNDGSTQSSNVSDYNNYSMEYAINNGLTNAHITGVAIAEVPLAYGTSLKSVPGLYIGGAIKYMRGITYTETIRIDNDGSKVNKETKNTNTFGIDLGLAYEPNYIKGMTLGLVAKNLNSPKFKVQGQDDYKISPMVKAGVSYDIFKSLEIALDTDITKNKTLIRNLDSQTIGGGLNYHPLSWFSLRGGLMQNIASGDKSGIIYTAGLGFGLKWFQLDISGQMANNKTTVQGTTYPREGKLTFALISRW